MWQGVLDLAAFEKRQRGLADRMAELAARERGLLAQGQRLLDTARILASMTEVCARLRQNLETATFEQRRALVELLIDRVVVTDAEVEIRYVVPTTEGSLHTRFGQLRQDYLHNPPPSRMARRAGRPHVADQRDVREVIVVDAGAPAVVVVVPLVQAQVLGWSGSGSGRSSTIAPIVLASSLASGTLAGATRIASGPPSFSTSWLHFTPFFARSVGLGPTSSPPGGPCPASHPPPATPNRSRRGPRIVQGPKIMVGKPVVRRTRIPLELVLEQLSYNLDLNELFAAYPRLTAEDVKACLAYAPAAVEAKRKRTARKETVSATQA